MATKAKNTNTEADNALPEGQAEKPRKKSKAKRIVIILFLLLITLSLAGGAAYWWIFLREPSAVPAGNEPMAEVQGTVATEQPAAPQGGDDLASTRIERQTDLPRSSGMVLPLPPVTVNLADPNGRRYLKLGMEVQVNGDVSGELKAKNAQIRDSIIMLLAGKTYGEVSSPDGKVLLKAEIAARLNQILGAQRVVQVYLTDFVVQ